MTQTILTTDHQSKSDSRNHTEELVQILRERQLNLTLGAEIGVLQGATSRGLLEAFPNLTLIMVDLWNAYHVRSAYAKSGDAIAKLHQLQHIANEQIAFDATAFASDRRMLLRANSAIACRAIGDQSLDFVFIDADHTYDAVKADIEAWWSKVKQGGLLSGHDYDSRLDRSGKWGVKRAVSEFSDRLKLAVHVGRHHVWWIEKQVN